MTVFAMGRSAAISEVDQADQETPIAAVVTFPMSINGKRKPKKSARNGVADKAPAYQWYPKDYDSDEVVKLMTYEEQGQYRKLLDHQWLEGSIPADPDQLAALLGLRGSDARRFVSEGCKRILAKFRRKGRSAVRLVNRRMERERAKRAEFLKEAAKAGRRGARKRWGISR